MLLQVEQVKLEIMVTLLTVMTVQMHLMIQEPLAPRSKPFCPLKAGPRDGIAEVEGENDDSGA